MVFQSYQISGDPNTNAKKKCYSLIKIHFTSSFKGDALCLLSLISNSIFRADNEENKNGPPFE